MLSTTNWSSVLKSDLDKLSQLTSAHRKAVVTKLKEGERRIVTILFLDIQGFTAMSEKLDPEDVQLIIDNCFKILTSEVEKYHGYVDKYEGDRMMALFGSRQASEQDCERALRAALGMREKFNEINRILAQQSIKIGIRIGVNTGLVVTGRIGKGRDQDFTVMGDAVNLASRLETAAPPGEILISDEVKRDIGDVFVSESLGEITVKGKSQPIAVYVVKALNPQRAERWERSPFTKRSGYVRREKEHERLKAVYHDLLSAKKGARALSFVAPAGIGKSRLIHEFLREVSEGKDPHPLTIRAIAGAEQSQPFGIFADMIRKILSNEENRKGLFINASDEVRRLEQTIYFIAGMKEADDRLRSLDPQVLKLELQLAVKFVIERTAEEAGRRGGEPLYVHMEDLQWLDTASLECMEFLGNSLDAAHPIFFLWTYRPEFRPSDVLRKQFQLEEFELSPLTEHECGEILANVLGRIPLSKEDQEILIRRSGGNPFFMEELIQSLVDEGILKREKEDWILTRQIEESALPDSVNRILLARIDKLEPDLKESLMAAAVIGEIFPVKVMHAVGERMGYDAAQVDQRLSVLTELGFIFQRREAGLFGKQSSFRHALMRDVVYSTLLNHNKKILHELVGKSLEELFGERKEDHAGLLYRHFFYAGLTVEAVKFGRVALEQATRQHLPKEGLQMIREIRDLLNEGTLPKEEHFEVEVRLYDAECKFYDFLGKRNDQLKCIEALEQMASTNSEAKLKARIALHRANYFSAIGEFRQTKVFAEKGLLEMGEKGPLSRLRLDLLRTIGIACYSTGDYPAALEHYQNGLQLARELKDLSAEGGFLNTIGLVHFNTGNPTEALKYYVQAHKIMTEIGDRRGDGNSVGNQGLIYWTLGEYSRALEELNRSHMIFREIGFRKGQAVTLGNIGVIYHKVGQYEQALNCFERALRLRREIRDRSGEGHDLVNTGLVYMHLMNFPKALEYFKASERIAREVGSNYLLTEALNSFGIVYRKMGETDSNTLSNADEMAGAALKIAREHNLVPAQVKALSNLARVQYLMNKKEEALSLSKEAMQIIANQSGGVEGSEEEAHINHYFILKELGHQEEAMSCLEVLVTLINKRAERIKEEVYRKSFLESVRQNRYALEEWNQSTK